MRNHLGDKSTWDLAALFKNASPTISNGRIIGGTSHSKIHEGTPSYHPWIDTSYNISWLKNPPFRGVYSCSKPLHIPETLCIYSNLRPSYVWLMYTR